MSYNKELPDKALLDENNDFQKMLMVGGAMLACFIGGVFFGFFLVNVGLIF